MPGRARGSRRGHRSRGGSTPLVSLVGGRSFNTSDRMGSALGGSFRGLTTGHTIACLFRIDTQVDQGVLLDYLDTSGKGWGLSQYSATELRWRNANAAGTDWFYSAPYYPAADLGKVQLSILTYGGGATSISHWAGDEKVGADVTVDGYTLPQTSFRMTIGARSGGSAAHTGATVFGVGAWNRALTDAEIHYLYAYVAATGRLPPASIGGEANIYNFASVTGSSFPSTLVDEVGGSNLTVYVGSASNLVLERSSAPAGPMPAPIILAPSSIAELRNWYDAADYTAATGNWTAKAGAVQTTLAQPTAGKRPTKSATNAAFSNKPTVNADGVDDDLQASGVFVHRVTGANTVGFLGKWPGGGASYLVGQYATGYTFYRWDGGTDQMYADPNFTGGGYLGAGIGGVHLWLWSKDATGVVTLYKDGVALFSRAQTFPTGSAAGFALFSASGGGFSAAECAEYFNADRAITAAEAAIITAYFRNAEGYPV